MNFRVNKNQEILQTQNLTQPIRIFFNTSLLVPGSDPERTCLTVGQQYKRGNPIGNLACDTIIGLRFNCWSTCIQADLISPLGTTDFFLSLLTSASRKLNNYLYVTPVNGHLTSNIATCGDTNLYGIQNLTGWDIQNGLPGIDLYVIVTARPQHQIDGAIASAECQQDLNGRPIIGHLNLDPKTISLSSFSKANNYVLHEMFHLLGFTFAKVQSLPGVTNQINYLTRYVSSDSQQIRFINMTTISSEIKSHFACNDVRGAEMEDLNSAGNVDHFEKRIFFNDIMTGDFSTLAGDGMIVTRFTLALLQDLGYYKANFSAADPQPYGRGLGCTFLNERCETWSSIKNADGYFCDIETGDDRNHCTYDRFYKGKCDKSTWLTPIRPYYQHFTDPSKGALGEEGELRDHCAMYGAVRSLDCRVGGVRNTDTGEIFGNRSRCFQANLWSKSTNNGRVRTLAKCFEHACANGTSLYVRVGERWTKCNDAKDVTNVPFYDGTLYCPPVSSICAPGETSPWLSDEITNPTFNAEPDPLAGLWIMFQYLPPYIWTIIALALLATLIYAIIYTIWTIVKKMYDKGKKKKKKRTEDGMEIVDVIEQTKEVLRDEAKLLAKEKWQRERQKKIDKGEVLMEEFDAPDSD